MLRVQDHSRHFESSTERVEEERVKWFIKAREHRQKSDQAEDREENALLEFAASLDLASKAEIKQFQTKLDQYDEATVKALMANQKALDLVNERIEEKLGSAYVMEDGRRVFKSSDESWAIDEHGNRLDPEIDNIDALPKTSVTAEEYEADLNERTTLQQERKAIHDYQEKLDHARERSNADDFTKDELDELDKELESSMPLAVKREMPDYDPSQETTLKSDFGSSAKFSLPEMSSKAGLGVAPVIN